MPVYDKSTRCDLLLVTFENFGTRVSVICKVLRIVKCFLDMVIEFLPIIKSCLLDMVMSSR